ncbi:Hsp20/alpha crystallin family protein [Metabacillus sp. cB07]|uniref:Hsp20/alpha crystallin family protein n=1 Tax=Metabacillus sp. cB07 TaxID=2806989 RepID=UPI001939A42F|nr:Hsp20/alpha crystallin family protein [Metabacillus sp. cB07]
MENNRKDPMRMINEFFEARPKRSLLGNIDEYFKQSFSTKGFLLSMEEKDDSFLVKAELPGTERENIKLTIEDGHLVITVKGEKDAKESLQIPPSALVKNLKANYRNGVLKVVIPKKPSTEVKID